MVSGVCIHWKLMGEQQISLPTPSEWRISIQLISHYWKGDLCTTERFRLEETSGHHPGQVPCSARATWKQLSRTVSRWLLRLSTDGDSTTPLAACANCRSPSKWKSVSWCSEGASTNSAWAHSLLTWQWVPLRKAWLCPLHFPSGILYLLKKPPLPSLLQAKQPNNSQDLLTGNLHLVLHWDIKNYTTRVKSTSLVRKELDYKSFWLSLWTKILVM